MGLYETSWITITARIGVGVGGGHEGSGRLERIVRLITVANAFLLLATYVVGNAC